MSRSIMFVSPDYHCSFFYRDALRELGWKADIYVPWSYPEQFLYSDQGILRPYHLRADRLKPTRWLNALLLIIWYLGHFWRYKYHVYYGSVNQISFFESRFRLTTLFGDSFRVSVWLARLFKRVIIYVPSGVPDEEMPEVVAKLGNTEAGIKGRDSTEMRIRFDMIRRYANVNVGIGTLNSSQYRATHFKYKVIDLELWNPNMAVPSRFYLPRSKNIRILHSFANRDNRTLAQGGDIKGSKYVGQAVQQLIDEGYDVEYLFLDKIPSEEMRYYQVQADIVVDQLIRGWWGSTSVEALALGTPVVCFLRPTWKEFFLETFPEYEDLPIVEANTETIYDALKLLVTDHDYRETMGRKSRLFAEQHFDPKINSKTLADILSKV